ncbi:flagellin N-terminal helical domain-containing protein [Agrobacterium radiobacter]|jgi:flagellin|uniref:flagellin N-terminal helical domain-containing protein n=1 Tax=Agrobacterium TaxID=357 RepID=UPI000D1D7EDE|nr:MULTISPECIES: flagellin [Agrobacterium]MBB4404841.1 flagellin [Agrobacterium radiobacter]MBB4451752.1 flagellin [Agrobacterium radiobacter]MDR6589051.1 flagellin [Agrobacterium tumefaciens]UNZ50678.1 flagellin [Agrobacterium tumefaciens]
MASILTNTNAMAALSTLRSIASDLSSTQDRISSGLKVGSASDNAAYWSIATTMRSDNKALGAVSDALGMGAAKVDTASAGMDAAIKVVTDIKAKVVAAKEQGVDKAKVQEEVTQLLDQLKSIGTSASFNGENWLVSSANATKTVVSGFVRDASGNVSVKTTDYALDATSMLYTEATPGTIDANSGILNATGATTTVGSKTYTQISVLDMNVTTDDLDNALYSVETALTKMTSAGAKLGSLSARIDLQTDFADKLSDTIEKGVGRLVDADMNEESTKLKALQTQQQLAIQALSIANSDSQNILSLFR